MAFRSNTHHPSGHFGVNVLCEPSGKSWFRRLKRSLTRRERRDSNIFSWETDGNLLQVRHALPWSPDCPKYQEPAQLLGQQNTLEAQGSPPSPSPLLSLPSELILEIAEYLSPRDVYAFLKTNRHTYPALRCALAHATFRDPNTAMTALCWALLTRQYELAMTVLKMGPPFIIMSMWGTRLYPVRATGDLKDDTWLRAPIHQYRIIAPNESHSAYSILNWALREQNRPMLNLLRVGPVGERMKDTGRLKYTVLLRGHNEVSYTDGYMYMGGCHNLYPTCINPY